MKTLTIDASLDKIDEVIGFVEAELEESGCPMGIQAQLSIAVDEIFSNIARYAYKNGGAVDVLCGIEGKQAVLVFSDSGIPYNPLERTDPDVTLSAEERQIGGLGIFMVKKSMDEIDYRFENGKNILTIKKNLP